MRRVLVIALDLAGICIKRERRVGIEVVAGPLVRDPGPWIYRAPINRVRYEVIDPRNPSRSSSSLVGLSFPGVHTRLARLAHCARFPLYLYCLRIACYI